MARFIELGTAIIWIQLLVLVPTVGDEDLLEQIMRDANRAAKEIAHLSDVGMEVDAFRLPIRPVVARFAQTFQFDPLRMISSGTLAATVPPDRVKDVKNALTKIGALLSDVGHVSDGAGVRLLRKEETKHYCHIRCEEDELTRMWTLYPRDG